jgi:hypothetical protein
VWQEQTSAKSFIGLIQGCTDFPKSQPQKILGTRIVTLSKSHNEDPQILGATIQNLVTMATRYLGFVHPWSKIIQGIPVWRKKQLLEGKTAEECKT